MFCIEMILDLTLFGFVAEMVATIVVMPCSGGAHGADEVLGSRGSRGVVPG